MQTISEVIIYWFTYLWLHTYLSLLRSMMQVKQ